VSFTIYGIVKTCLFLSDFENKNLWYNLWVSKVGNCHMFNPARITDDDGQGRAFLQTTVAGDLNG